MTHAQTEHQADVEFTISTFQSTTDAHPQPTKTTWAGLQKALTRHLVLADKMAARLWSPAVYRDGAMRGNAGVIELSVLAFDIDDGTTASALSYWLNDLEHIITSSYSHTPEQPKLRVVVRLAEPIPNEAFDDIWRRANQHLLHGHVDPSTKDPARIFFVPSAPPDAERVALLHAGRALDWRALPPLPSRRASWQRVRVADVPSSAGDDVKRAHGLLGKFAHDLAQTPDGERHFTLLQKARAAGGLKAGGLLSQHDIETALFDASAANGEVAKYGEADVLRAIRDGITYGEGAPWVPDDLPDTDAWTSGFRAWRNGVVNTGTEVVTEASELDWPTPANIDGPAAPPALPLDCFPRELVEHAEDVADRMQCPIDYVVWTLLVTLSTVIGRAVGIRPKRLDDWTERPALWVALIGDPSSMKTPGMNAGVRLLHALSARLRDEYRSAVQNWRAACAAARQADPKHPALPTEPQLRWLVVDDATTEKMSDLLQPEISRGLAFVRDEVSGLIRECERYRARAGDREFLLQAYSGGPKSVARISRSPVFVPDLLLNIVGGIQPDVAREVFASGADDGLGERFLAIWPALPSTFVDVDRFPNKERRDAFDLVAKRLYWADWAQLLITDDFSPVPYCRVTHAAHDIFSAWRSRTVLSTRGDDPRYDQRFGRRVGKYPGVAARIALILHLFEETALPTAHEAKANLATVDTHVMERVTRLMDSYVLPMERRVYVAYGVAPEAENARRIARWIRKARPQSFSARDIRRHEWANLDNQLAVAAALEWLCSRGWLREANPEKRPGRPSEVFLVNPRIAGA